MKIPAFDPKRAKDCVECGHLEFLEAERHARLLIERLAAVAEHINTATAHAGMIQDQNEAPAMLAEVWELHGKANALLKDIHRYHAQTVFVVRDCGLEVPVTRGGGTR